MDKSFVKQFVQIGASTIINLLIGVFTTPVITRLVLPGDYGQLSLFNTYSSIIMIVFCCGLDQALIRYYYVNDDKYYKIKLLNTCIKFPLVSITILSVCLLGYCIAKSRFSSLTEIIIVGLFILNLYITALNRFSILLVRLNYHTGLYSIINIAHKISYVLFVILGAVIFKSHYLLILVCSTVIAAGVMLLMSVLGERSFWIHPTYKKFDLDMSKKEIFQYCVPLMVASCVFSAFQAIDKLSIDQYMTYSDVGVYSSAQSLMTVFSIVQTSFNTIWSPKAIEHYEKNENDTDFFKTVHQIMVVVMIFFGCTVLLFKDVFVLLLGSNYRDASFVIPFLMFNPIMYTLSETTVNGLYFKKKSRWQVVITVISCLINIIGNSLLIPILGIKGAAVSTGISYILLFELRTYFSNKFYYVNFELWRLRLILLLMIIFSVKCMNGITDIITVGMYVLIITALVVLYKKPMEIFKKEIIKVIRKK